MQSTSAKLKPNLHHLSRLHAVANLVCIFKQTEQINKWTQLLQLNWTSQMKPDIYSCFKGYKFGQELQKLHFLNVFSAQ